MLPQQALLKPVDLLHLPQIRVNGLSQLALQGLLPAPGFRQFDDYPLFLSANKRNLLPKLFNLLLLKP